MSFYTRPITMIPGGIPFTDPLTPRKKFPGMEVSTEDEQVQRIITWRRQNPAIYKDAKWLDASLVLQELRQYQLNRLGNNRAYFTNGTNLNIPLPVKQKEPSRPCPFCGATDATANYCKTCGGHKIKSWKCNNCGKDRGL
jgi:hypothetical protein